MSSANTQKNQDSMPPVEKKSYQSPKLERLGSVEKVQAFVDGQATESASSGVYDRTIT